MTQIIAIIINNSSNSKQQPTLQLPIMHNLHIIQPMEEWEGE
jgi:hypothetical protein